MDISATDRNPEPGDNPLLFSTDSKGSFRCTQPDSYAHHQAFVKPVRHYTAATNPHRIRTRDLLLTSDRPYACHHRVRTGRKIGGNKHNTRFYISVPGN